MEIPITKHIFTAPAGLGIITQLQEDPRIATDGLYLVDFKNWKDENIDNVTIITIFKKVLGEMRARRVDKLYFHPVNKVLKKVAERSGANVEKSVDFKPVDDDGKEVPLMSLRIPQIENILSFISNFK